MSLPFLDFPAEIREQVYNILLRTANAKIEPSTDDDPPFYNLKLDLFLVSKQIYGEALKVFQDNVFVKITTPWEQAIEHINGRGKVPIVACGEHATKFKDYHLLLDVGHSTEHGFQHSHSQYSMLICLEDLSHFTQTWHHSHLDSQNLLNSNLRLTLTLQDRHVPTRKLPKPLQEQLLLPFGCVKDLEAFLINGPEILPSVQEALEKARKTSDPTIEECLDRAIAIKKEGNDLLGARNYSAALAKYREAHAAIHITHIGRKREIHCEEFYTRPLNSGPYKNQRGLYPRILIRIQLVANIVFLYLQTREYEEAYFWGKRSILLYKDNIWFDDNTQLGGEGWDRWLCQAAERLSAPQEGMGKIMYRTALAAKELGKTDDELATLKGARAFLPRDPVVKVRADEAVRKARERVQEAENREEYMELDE